MTATSDLPWVNPGAFEVADNVYRVPLPLPNDGLKAVNVYVIVTSEGLVCVDSGWSIPESRDLFVSSLASLGHELADVQRFLVTHVHRDHYTQAVAVRREVGSHVALGEGERPTLELLHNAERSPFADQYAGLIACGAPDIAETIQKYSGGARAERTDWELPDTWLGAGPVELVGRTLEAVETPGHTRGHLVFYDVAGGLLFAGDHVLPTITPSIGFEPVMMANPLGAFMESLRVVRSRPDARLLPAHGPVAESAHARVDELLAHHDTRLEQTLDGVRAGAHTAAEVAASLRWTRRLTEVKDMDVFNAMLAVFETNAHLELLVAQGRLSVTDEAGIHLYTL